MKFKVTAALAALMMLTGCGAAAEAAPRPLTKTQSAAPIVEFVDEGQDLQEDDPGWDCWIHGNKVCGTNPIERTAAWGAFRAESVPAEFQEKGFKVQYLGHALEGVDFPPSEYVTIPSALTPGKVNVFMVQVNQ